MSFFVNYFAPMGSFSFLNGRKVIFKIIKNEYLNKAFNVIPELQHNLVKGLNKPYGLPNNPAKDIPYSVTGCLTDLAEHLNIGNIYV